MQEDALESVADPAIPLPATIDHLSWLAGSWSGSKERDDVEEHWSHPSAGTMMGMFRWVQNGNVWFYELTTIEEENGTLYFRIKHFNRGLVGWEEKAESVVFILVQSSPGKAVFSRVHPSGDLLMVYERDEHNRLKAYFEKEPGVHKPEDEFVYSRS